MSTMSSKENIAPVRKSKIPVPRIPSLPTKKGMKRAVSPSACTNDCKRSPSGSKGPYSRNQEGMVPKTNGQRKVLGALPCEQRKIVKVRRLLNESSTATSMKGAKRAVGTIVETGKADVKTGDSKKEVFGVKLSGLPDQSGIVFEKDDFALQSILDETGIQFEQPKAENQHPHSKFTRHTLAAEPKAKRESTVSSSAKVCFDDFRKVCDDFITRTANKQPNPKRRCTGRNFKNENLNLKLTPSKTDFCSKYGVEKSVTFQGVAPGLSSRQSLPGRTRVRPPDPFAVPGRCSVIAQNPRRLAKVGEEREPEQNTFDRLSLATPLRVLKKVKQVADSQHSAEATDIACKPNIHPQTPGRVSLSAQNVGRSCEASVFSNRFSLTSQAPVRQGLAAQTPGRVSLYEKGGNGVSIQATGRMSMATQPPGRVSLIAQKSSQQINHTDTLPDQGRPSLAAQMPGRVSLAAQKPKPNLIQGRVSMIDQTPGRVKKLNQGPSGSGEVRTCTDFSNICENLQAKFLMQTPGRAPREKRNEEKNENDRKKEEQSENKDVVSKTPTKDKAVPAYGTPLRVKQLQTDKQTPKSSPQRVLKPVSTPQHTPRRVLVTGDKSGVTTPKQNTNTPQGPLRFPWKSSTPSTPFSILLSGSDSGTSLDTFQKDPSLKQTALQKVQNGENPQEVVGKQKTLGKHTSNKKSPNSSRAGLGADLRTFWKTKKTPSKSPVLKEVLTQDFVTEESTPKSCSHMANSPVVSTIKRKKTLTWADTLESCQSPDSGLPTLKTEDERWQPQEVNTQSSHDAMQDNPHQEKSSSSPTQDTHVSTLMVTQNNLDNMQLPVCLTGSSSACSVSTSGSINLENKPEGEDPCSEADDTLLSHPKTFAQLETDSLLVSQQELGQHHSNVLANTTQNEFLQKQIELFEEKKRQLTQLQMKIQQQLFKASDPRPARLEHELDNAALTQATRQGQIKNGNGHAELSEENLMEQAKLDNHQFSKNLNDSNLDFLYTSNASSQGNTVFQQVNLDLNSNVTVSNDTLDNSPSEARKDKQSSPFVLQNVSTSGTQEVNIFCTPTQQKLTSNVEGDITPYILKTNSDQTETVKDEESNKRGHEFENVLFNAKSSEEICSSQTELVSVPLWTPLAMKTVAKQQTLDKVKEEHQAVQNIDSSVLKDTKSVCKPKFEIEAKDDIDTSSSGTASAEGKLSGLVPDDETEIAEEKESTYKLCPKTPPKTKSAFRNVGGTGLTPVIGSLSLKGNTEEKREIPKKVNSRSLHSNVLRVANERYLEALLDDEVALFMCRLSPGRAMGKGREMCCDPVAKILLQGDDMHFVPIDRDYSQTPSVYIEGSAFTKYAIRAT